MQKKSKILSYSGICVAIAIILSKIDLFKMPQGGSVSLCSMLFIALIGYWFGVKVGVVAGFACGLLQVVLGGYVVHIAQMFLDYPLAYASLGLSGLFRNKKFGLYKGYLFGCFFRFLCSFLSGVVFFGSYASAGKSVFAYSAGYNLSYLIPEIIISLLILALPQVKTAIDAVKA